jgi:glycosyltransferase involved in cell wall biosynthesis
MRIAIVCDFYLDYVGGAQSSIQEQRAALEEAGHTVFLVSTVRRRRGSRVRMRTGALEIRPAWTVPGVILPVVGARMNLVTILASYLRMMHVDVVHLQTEFGLAHAATRAARNLGLPVVHTVHTLYWQSTGPWTSLLAPILRASLENVTQSRFTRRRLSTRPTDNLLRNLTLTMALEADVVVSPSAHQAADLAHAGVTVPIVVIPNPIARSPRPVTPLALDEGTRPRLLWVARCEPEKRPLVFIEAVIEALARTDGGFDVDLVGDGSQLQRVRGLADGIPNIHIHGKLDHGAVIDLMDKAALVVLTSYGFDNQPMTIAEAISRRRGVLYCDPKLAEGLVSAGCLAATPDVRGLANAIVALIGTPSRLRALAAGADSDAGTFAPAAYVDKIVEAYRYAGAEAPAMVH